MDKKATKSLPKYWLIKSEPTSYSIDDLKKDKVTAWEGVRNYQARNFMRDDPKAKDGNSVWVCVDFLNSEQVSYGGVCLKKSEPISSRTLASPLQSPKRAISL